MKTSYVLYCIRLSEILVLFRMNGQSDAEQCVLLSLDKTVLRVRNLLVKNNRIIACDHPSVECSISTPELLDSHHISASLMSDVNVGGGFTSHASTCHHQH